MTLPSHILPLRRPWLVGLSIIAATPTRSRKRRHWTLDPMPDRWLKPRRTLGEWLRDVFTITDGGTE